MIIKKSTLKIGCLVGLFIAIISAVVMGYYVYTKSNKSIHIPVIFFGVGLLVMFVPSAINGLAKGGNSSITLIMSGIDLFDPSGDDVVRLGIDPAK
jgi:predicted membrane channel-forming protein YqfA (hemolysin III family)